jgi:ABC-type molybdenum transport system ATPase subunit/photorepair protein PhrA
MTDHSVSTVTIPPDLELDGSGPIVIIGPNGAGKTRLGVEVAKRAGVELISARRNIQLQDNVVMRPLEQAQNELVGHRKRRRQRWWELSNEINDLFSKLLAEDSTAAIRFRGAWEEDKTATPTTTKLMRLQAMWGELFPGREVSFESYAPKVTADHLGGSATYTAQSLSDGERVALYLAARVLDAEPGVIVVDEPEVHFHGRLASRFWNRMQAERPDLRFVYITHDLPFALSRGDAAFVLVRSGGKPELISVGSEIPADVADALLSAASFSIHAKRVVFCEGDEGLSSDQLLYGAWFRGADTAVIPVGSCRSVLSAVSSFSGVGLVTGLTPIGIIDRDFWPDRFLKSLPEGVTALDVHEVESLYCIRGVFVAVASHLGKDTPDAESLYDQFLAEARRKLTAGVSAKLVLERFRREAEHDFDSTLNGLKVNEDRAAMTEATIEALAGGDWSSQVGDTLSRVGNWVDERIGGDEAGLLELAEGKMLFPIAARTLGLNRDQFVEVVCTALRAPDSDALRTLGKRVAAALEPYLPSRSV